MAEENEKREYGTRRGKKWFFWFCAAALSTAAVAYFFHDFPEADIGPRQPIYFSHRVHAGVKKINCRFCHPFVERSAHAGLPAMEKCFYCHEYVIPTHPQIVKEKEHYRTKKPVPWVRIFYIPDYVKFKHLPHIKWAGLDCVNCHGRVETMDRLREVEFEMGFCIGCHKERKAQADCWLACHH